MPEIEGGFGGWRVAAGAELDRKNVFHLIANVEILPFDFS